MEQIRSARCDCTVSAFGVDMEEFRRYLFDKDILHSADEWEAFRAAFIQAWQDYCQKKDVPPAGTSETSEGGGSEHTPYHYIHLQFTTGDGALASEIGGGENG